MWFLLDVVYCVAAVLYAPVLVYQRFAGGKRRTGWRERFGCLPPRPDPAPCVWIHAVSLGETNATRSIVDALRRERPDLPIAISTTTDTGYARAREIYPDLYVFRYPLDFSWVVRRSLRTVRPAVIVLMELEVWPNLVRLAARHGIPVAVANGRVTEDRSMRRFRKPLVRQIARATFARLTWVGAQNQTYAERFRELGVPSDRVHITGLLKWDTAEILDQVPGAEPLRTAVGLPAPAEGQPVWVCGQTGPGEEQAALDAFRLLRRKIGNLRLVIVPRKPERFDEVARLVAKTGLPYVRRSEHRDGSPPPPTAPDVVLGDTLGELRKFYSLATAAFVGRSLVPMGGSDVAEVAALAKPIIVGPHCENFEDSVAALRAAGGLLICQATVDEPQAAARLADCVGPLLADRRIASEMGIAARRVVQENRGVTQRTVAAILRLVNHAQHGTP